jgi:hypothetical protein
MFNPLADSPYIRALDFDFDVLEKEIIDFSFGDIIY